MHKYPAANRILVATDCIIFGFDGEEIKLLVIKRNFKPEKGKWSLMGGFVKQDEDLEDGASRILHDLTGLTDIYVEQIMTCGKVQRDPVERTISVVFFALINIHDQEIHVGWAWNPIGTGDNHRPEFFTQIHFSDKYVEEQ